MRNPVAKAVRKIRPTVVRARKGKGSFSRKLKHSIRIEELHVCRIWPVLNKPIVFWWFHHAP